MMQLKTDQVAALQKLFQIGINRGADMLNYITESPISWELFPLEILSPQQLQEKLEQDLGLEQIVSMELAFSGEFQGNAQLVFPRDSAALLVNLIANEERRQLDQDALRKETVSEVGNIFFNGIMGAISTVVERGITYMIPRYREGTVHQLLPSNKNNVYAIALLGKVQFKIEEVQDGSKKQLHSFGRLLPSKYVKLFIDKFQSGKSLIFFLEVDTLDVLLNKVNNLSDYFGEGY